MGAGMPRLSDIDYSELPEHMRDGMRRYLEKGIEPGGFLLAVLENDFMGAVTRADPVNLHRLLDYVHWLYHHAPPASYGNRQKVRDWIGMMGWHGVPS
jgi:hypothetical protein